LFSPGIWPEQAQKWYALYAHYFWQESWGCAGFREFPNDLPGNNWDCDVDAGPVLGGFGCAACAFGVGAARSNGHFEHAYPLTAEMLVTSWPLPNGMRLFPRLFSNAADAPYLGEASILFNLTRMPAKNIQVQTGGSIPKFALIFLALQIGIGLLMLIAPIRSLYYWRKHRETIIVANPHLQFGIWIGFLIAGIICLLTGKSSIAILLFICTQIFPKYKNAQPTQTTTHES
jgi:hypothetical protein